MGPGRFGGHPERHAPRADRLEVIAEHLADPVNPSAKMGGGVAVVRDCKRDSMHPLLHASTLDTAVSVARVRNHRLLRRRHLLVARSKACHWKHLTRPNSWCVARNVDERGSFHTIRCATRSFTNVLFARCLFARCTPPLACSFTWRRSRETWWTVMWLGS